MKSVIVTVDTEGHIGKDPVKHLIFGKTKNDELCGIPLIMDLCDEVGAKALFFVDIAEAWDYGEEKIADVLRYIKSRGHDVGVHIHPDHMIDRKRAFLSQYSYEEQFDIIERCTNFYKTVLGESPKAFRAGKYGANRETLDILAKLGYKADFSEYFGYEKWCHIIPPVTDNRSVTLENGLIEFPVMSYENYCKGLFHRFDKLDINRSLFEHKYILNRIIAQESINVVTLFAHSFSLMRWRSNPDKPRLNRSEVFHLRKALRHVSESDKLVFVTLNELLSEQYPIHYNDDLFVFQVTGVIALYLYLQKAFRTVISWLQIWYRNRKNSGESII